VTKVVEGLPVEWGMCSRIVLLNNCPWTLSYWNNTIAIGSAHKDILVLDAITGSQTAVLSGHEDQVRSLTFSSDGISLVSGSFDKTVKLWDVQTGGVVKTFHGHTDRIYSVSISADHITIASGSEDKTLRLWDIQTGECHQIIEQWDRVTCISFSPKNLQCLLISTSGGTVQQWNTNGHKVGPTYSGYQIAFSPDDSGQFISCAGIGITVQNIDSGVVVAKFHTKNGYYYPCCFSPDGRFVAFTARRNAYVLDITGSDPYLVGTFVGHTNDITSLAFSSPSTLISVSLDKSVKFWQIGTLSTDQVMGGQKSIPFTPAPTKSISLKARNDIFIPNNLDGVIKTWGITGLCKGSLQIPAKDSHQSNIQLIDSKLIFAWYTDDKINIWDAKKGELLWTINVSGGAVKDLRVSGDGIKIFCLYEKFIQAWDIWTREAVGTVKSEWNILEVLAMEGSKIWIKVLVEAGASYPTTEAQGWDFEVPGSPPVGVSDEPPDMLCLNENKQWETNMSRMKDTITGKVIFQLPERFGKVVHVQWGDQYLVVSFVSREVLVLDLSHVLL